MRTNPWPWVTIAALALAAAAMLGRQRQTAVGLRAEIAGQRALVREHTRLQAENQRLAATQATPAELDTLFADRAAVAQLQAELDSLRHRATESAARLEKGPEQAAPTLPLTGNVLAHPLWKNRGAATPAAALETALWASAGGDIEALASLLAFEPDAQAEALALYAQLPEKLRQEFVSPERLVAVLSAKDVPLGSATILGEYPSAVDTIVSAKIFDAEGQQKRLLFSLRAEGDRWRLVVPENAVKRYAAWLHAPAAAAKPAD